MQVQFLGWEDRAVGVANGNLLQYSCLENSMERPGGLPSMGFRRDRPERDCMTRKHMNTHTQE